MAQVAVGMGQSVLVLGLFALIGLALLCGTVITLVLVTAKTDRPAAIRELAPVLVRLADKVSFRSGGRRDGRAEPPATSVLTTPESPASAAVGPGRGG